MKEVPFFEMSGMDYPVTRRHVPANRIVSLTAAKISKHVHSNLHEIKNQKRDKHLRTRCK